MAKMKENPTDCLQGIADREIARLDAISKATGLNEKEIKILDTLVKIQKTLTTFESPSESNEVNVSGMSDEELEELAG